MNGAPKKRSAGFYVLVAIGLAFLSYMVVGTAAVFLLGPAVGTVVFDFAAGVISFTVGGAALAGYLLWQGKRLFAGVLAVGVGGLTLLPCLFVGLATLAAPAPTVLTVADRAPLEASRLGEELWFAHPSIRLAVRAPNPTWTLDPTSSAELSAEGDGLWPHASHIYINESGANRLTVFIGPPLAGDLEFALAEYTRAAIEANRQVAPSIRVTTRGEGLDQEAFMHSEYVYGRVMAVPGEGGLYPVQVIASPLDEESVESVDLARRDGDPSGGSI